MSNFGVSSISAVVLYWATKKLFGGVDKRENFNAQPGPSQGVPFGSFGSGSTEVLLDSDTTPYIDTPEALEWEYNPPPTSSGVGRDYDDDGADDAFFNQRPHPIPGNLPLENASDNKRAEFGMGMSREINPTPVVADGGANGERKQDNVGESRWEDAAVKLRGSLASDVRNPRRRKPHNSVRKRRIARKS